MTCRPMMWKGLALIASALLMAACTPPSPASSKPTTEFFPSHLSFDTMFFNTTVKCDDPDDCPGNVGMVVFPAVDEKGEKGFAQCTGSLVGEDLVLTASHCIPDDVKFKDIDCSTQVAFVRVGMDRYPQKIRCSEIVDFSRDPLKSGVDYALFRLKEKATGVPMRISRQGVPDNVFLKAFTVDPIRNLDEKGNVIDGSNLHGLLKRKVCRSVMHSRIAPGYIHPLSRVISLIGDDRCLLVGGNSGSALIFEDEIRGVVSRGRKTANVVQLLRGREVKMGVGVNLACRSLPGFAATSPECANVPTDDLLEELSTTEGITHHSKETLERLIARAPIFRYKFEVTGRRESPDPDDAKLLINGSHEYLRLKFTLTPVCVLPRSRWPGLGVRIQSRQGNGIVSLAPPFEGDLTLTLVVDGSARASVVSRAQNVSSRVSNYLVSTFGSEKTPWCKGNELSQKITF